MALDEIQLLPDQRELLREFVESTRRMPRGGREPFMCIAVATSHNLLIAHPDFSDDHPGAYPGDLDALAAEGLVRLSSVGGGTRNVDLTPLAFRYYDWLQAQAGQPTLRMEKELRSLMDGESFRRAHPEAYAKWQQAEALLWATDANAHVSTVGHLCREALQEYAGTLVTRLGVQGVPADPAKTVARIRAVLGALSTGATEAPFLEALLTYWGTLSDLVQRQEHAGAKEGEAVTVADAGRVVLHTLLVMYEVEQAIIRSHARGHKSSPAT